jgi:uncharacterized protein YjbJ (UPF0337 family)
MSGRADEVKGGLKKGLGKLTGDEALEAEGQGQQEMGRARRKTSGAAKETAGKVKRTVGGAIDSPTLKAEGEADKAKGKAERI